MKDTWKRFGSYIVAGLILFALVPAAIIADIIGSEEEYEEAYEIVYEETTAPYNPYADEEEQGTYPHDEPPEYDPYEDDDGYISDDEDDLEPTTMPDEEVLDDDKLTDVGGNDFGAIPEEYWGGVGFSSVMDDNYCCYEWVAIGNLRSYVHPMGNGRLRFSLYDIVPGRNGSGGGGNNSYILSVNVVGSGNVSMTIRNPHANPQIRGVETRTLESGSVEQVLTLTISISGNQRNNGHHIEIEFDSGVTLLGMAFVAPGNVNIVSLQEAFERVLRNCADGCNDGCNCDGTDGSNNGEENCDCNDCSEACDDCEEDCNCDGYMNNNNCNNCSSNNSSNNCANCNNNNNSSNNCTSCNSNNNSSNNCANCNSNNSNNNCSNCNNNNNSNNNCANCNNNNNSCTNCDNSNEECCEDCTCEDCEVDCTEGCDCDDGNEVCCEDCTCEDCGVDCTGDCDCDDDNETCCEDCTCEDCGVDCTEDCDCDDSTNNTNNNNNNNNTNSGNNNSNNNQTGGGSGGSSVTPSLTQRTPQARTYPRLEGRPELVVAPAEWNDAEPYAQRFRRNFVQGYPNGTFNPNGHMTRAEMIQLFFNISNGSLTSVVGSTTRFHDIQQDAWFFYAVAYLENRGAIQGFPDMTLRPNEPITNAEFATLTVQFFNLADIIEPDMLMAAESHWGANYINLGFARGWFEYFGITETFDPDAPILRAQAVALLNFYQGRVPCPVAINAYLAGSNRNMLSDLRRGHWSFYEIIEAALARYYYENSYGNTTWLRVVN